MRIQWLIDSNITKEINGKKTRLLLNHEYDVPDDSKYFQDAIKRKWAKVIKTTKKEVEDLPEKEAIPEKKLTKRHVAGNNNG